MENYQYKAFSPEGKKIHGLVKASTLEGARNVLVKQKFTVVNLSKQSPGLAVVGNIFKRVSVKDKIIFTEQLGVMIKSGLSVVEALRSLEDEMGNHYFKNALFEIRNQVESGSELSRAMATFPKIFSEDYIQVVKSGEVTGSLSDVLKRIADHLQKDYELVAKIKGAMIYPIIILILLLGVIIIIITFIIPKLKGVFEDAGTTLPLSTRILMAVSDNFLKYSWLIVIVLFFSIIAFRLLTRRGRGQIIWHTIKLKLPVYGTFSTKVAMARFTQIFASLSSAGVPILNIFETSQNTISNVVIKNELIKIGEDVGNGVPISFAFKKSKHFPPMIAQMATVGEKSGDMNEVFSIISNFYEKEVDQMAKNLSAAVEPIIMVVMGLGVGFILMSVLQPMYGLLDTM